MDIRKFLKTAEALHAYQKSVLKEDGTIFSVSVSSRQIHVHVAVGRQKAIEPGEPADLIVETLQKAYKKLGRDKIIELIESGKSENEIKAIAKKDREQ